MQNKSTPDQEDTDSGTPQRQTMHLAIWIILIAMLAFFVYLIFLFKI